MNYGSLNNYEYMQSSRDVLPISNVLVLDARQRSALAVTRSLGRTSGLRVFAADDSKRALAGKSRFCFSYHRHPPISSGLRPFAVWLIRFVQTNRIDVVIPITDLSTQAVLALRDDLRPCTVPFAAEQTVMSVANKWTLLGIASRIGVPCPRSIHVQRGNEVPDSLPFPFPVVLKPELSQIPVAGGWLRTSVRIARVPAELGQIASHEEAFREHPFIIQEYIDGHGAGIFALYDRGRPATFFSHKRIREKPPSGGVSVVSESAPLDPQILDLTRKLLDEVDWHGVAMVEYRVSESGVAYLMEVNTRFWGSLQLAIDSGVDFPALLIRLCRGEAVIQANYKQGQRLRWLLGDLDNLIITLRDRGTFSLLQKAQAILRFMTPHPIATRHEVNRWNDLGPALYELREYVQALIANSFQRGRSRS